MGIFAFLAIIGLGFGMMPALGFSFAAGFGLPYWMLSYLKKRRENKFLAAFPDAVDVIVRGIKSGLPVHDCLKLIARESPPPVDGEFQRLVEGLGLGMSLDQGLERMFDSMPTAEVRFFSIVMAIQHAPIGQHDCVDRGPSHRIDLCVTRRISAHSSSPLRTRAGAGPKSGMRSSSRKPPLTMASRSTANQMASARRTIMCAHRRSGTAAPG